MLVDYLQLKIANEKQYLSSFGPATAVRKSWHPSRDTQIAQTDLVAPVHPISKTIRGAWRLDEHKPPCQALQLP